MNYLSLIIDWFGPYDYEEAMRDAQDYYGKGLYVLIGKTKHQKSKAILQYIGISNELSSRFQSKHTALLNVNRELKIWLGEIGSFGIPGKKTKVTNICLDYAEWAHAYFLELPLNERKTKNPPDRPVTVLNKWWQKDFETPRIKRPHPDWPDLIDFLGSDYGARVCWFGKNIKRWNPVDFC